MFLALSALLVWVIAAGLLIWWFLLRGPAPRAEPDSIIVEAEGDEGGPIVVPGRAPAPAMGIVRSGVAEIEGRIAAQLAADLPTSPLSGPLAVRVRDVEWRDPAGERVLGAAAIDAILDAGALQIGNVIVREAVLSAPEVFLSRAAADDAWTIERLFAGVLQAGPPTAPPPSRPFAASAQVVLQNVAIDDGRVVIDPPGPETYRLSSIDAVLTRVVISSPTEPTRIDAARLALVAVVPQAEAPLFVTTTDAVVRFPEGAITVETPALVIDDVLITELAAAYAPDAPGLGLEARGRVERLAFEDVRFLLPEEWPPEGSASFRFSLESQVDARTALRLEDLVAEAAGSRVAGSLALALGPDTDFELLSVDLDLEPLTLALLERLVGPIPYAGELRGRVVGVAPEFEFDVVAHLISVDVPEPFLAEISGIVVLNGEGFSLSAADIELTDVPLGALRPVAPGLPLAGRVTGRITVSGPPGGAPLTLDVRLVFAEGVAEIAGTLDPSRGVTAYDLSGRLIDVNLNALLEPEVPPVSLTAAFTLVGSGTDPETADARITLRGRFTGWQTGPADTVLLRGVFSGGTLRLDAGTFRLATLSVEAEGTWRFVTPVGGALAYDVVISRIDPFTPYVHFLADAGARGELATTGELTGTLDAPRFVGELVGSNLEYREWTAEDLEATYDLWLIDPVPELRTAARAEGVQAPNGDVYEVATVELTIDEPLVALILDAERADGGILQLVANGSIDEERAIDAYIRRLNVDLDDQRWALVRTARVEWTPDEGAVVSGLLLQQVDGEGLIALDGPLPPAPTEVLRIEVMALPVGDVLRLLGQEPVVTGDLWLDARAFGPADAPRVGADFRLVGGQVGTVYATAVVGAILYEDGRLTMEATAELDTLGSVQLEASLPMILDFTVSPVVDILADLPLRASLRADTLPLEAVTMLTPELRDAEGALRASVFITGTPRDPALDGAIQVWNGAVTIPAFNQRYEEISADIVLEDDVVFIRDARARSDGWAVATGTVRFPSLTEPVVNVIVDFDGFRALGVEDREDAAVWGRLALRGELTQPVVSGDVTLDDGDVVVPSFDGGDIDVELAELDDAQAVEPLAELDAAVPAPWFGQVLLDDVIVEAGEDLWFSTEGARARLSGELVLVRGAGDESVRIFGDLSGDRGTFILRAGPLIRQFDIVSAEVQFFGTPEPNPALDIVASRVVPSPNGQLIEIQIRIGGTLDAPTVALTTADGQNIPESELISYLLFGQPSFALADDGLPAQPLVQEALFGVGSLAELASIELEEALIGDIGLPLEYFQIRPAAGQAFALGAPTVVFGVEVADDVFLTVNAALAGVFGTAAGTEGWTATLQWRIDPEWRLELGIAPVDTRRLLPGFATVVPAANPEQQFIIELLRRWTY